MIVEKHGFDDQPTGLLRYEHELITRALLLLEREAKALEQGSATARGRLTQLTEFIREFADRRHHGKEEDVLFVAMEEAGLPRDVGPLAMMRLEHDQGRALVRTMVGGDDAAAAKAARDFARLLAGHIQKENGVLYPMAEEMLSPDAIKRMLRRFAEVEEASGGDATRADWVARLDALAAAS
jgi:hemerythrin-like domain-containing protein